MSFYISVWEIFLLFPVGNGMSRLNLRKSILKIDYKCKQNHEEINHSAKKIRKVYRNFMSFFLFSRLFLSDFTPWTLLLKVVQRKNYKAKYTAIITIFLKKLYIIRQLQWIYEHFHSMMAVVPPKYIYNRFFTSCVISNP